MNLDWLKRIFGLHVHTRELFCVGGVVFVKCMECGAESPPWVVEGDHAKSWADSHPKAIQELIEIDRKIREKKKK